MKILIIAALIFGNSLLGQDSLKISKDEAIKFYLLKQKYPICMEVVDSMTVQIQDLESSIDFITQREKEKAIQLNLEKLKSRKKNWVIAGSTFAGVVVGVLVGLLIPK